MTTSVEKLVESFPHPHIPAIEGPPNYETITDITRLLNANAASIHSELGGGNYGHLVLTISAASYAKLSPVACVPPANPGTIQSSRPSPLQPSSAKPCVSMMKASDFGANTTT
jgi:hypothetical protein